MQAIIDLLAICLIKNFKLENTIVSNASELPTLGGKYTYIVLWTETRK